MNNYNRRVFTSFDHDVGCNEERMGREEMEGRRKEGEWEVLIIEGLKH